MRFVGAPARALLLAAALLAAWAVASHAPTRAATVSPAASVNPFIGTEDEGNTFPGPSLPFGMVQLSPDSGRHLGYGWSDRRIEGFSHTHLSGVGCPTMGDVSFMPTTGRVTETRADHYASPIDHATESAHPGNYAVTLARYGVRAELTATTRTGWHRYTFPATGQANVMVNVGDALERTLGSSVHVVDDHTLAGSVSSGRFCHSNNSYRVYFVAQFSRPFSAHGTWRDRRTQPGSGRSTGRRTDESNGAWVTFDTRANRTVIAKVGLSYVNTAGAARNLAGEAPGFDFDAVRARAGAAWDRALGRVQIDGGSAEQRAAFYSALYRAQLTPTTFSDADGRYPGFDGRTQRTGGRTQYANLSLWDTYRTQNQLLELLVPGVARDIHLSLIADAEQNGGWVPRWPLAAGDTNVMTGDPATPFLVDGWSKGLLYGHGQEAFRLLWRNVNGVPPFRVGTLGRVGNPVYVRKGFVPLGNSSTPKGNGDDDLKQAGSATLEYALADCSLGQMARGLGHPTPARKLIGRGRNYRRIWDARNSSFRARRADGSWGPLETRAGAGFHEGGPDQYQWMVPQDMSGLVRLLGGPARTARRLDAFFALDHLTTDPSGTARKRWITGPYSYYDGDTYNPNNEPDLHAPWAYAWVGQPWKTSQVLRAAQTLFGSRPNGLTGNDDLGTMSAWYVFAALGVYPLPNGAATYVLNAPLFPHATVQAGRRTITIDAPAAAPGNPYVQHLQVGGRPWSRVWMTHNELLGAGTLHFDLGGRAGARWGTTHQPPSPCG